MKTVLTTQLAAANERIKEDEKLIDECEAAMNSPSGRKYVEALASITAWREGRTK